MPDSSQIILDFFSILYYTKSRRKQFLQPLINYLYSPQKTDGSPIGLLLLFYLSSFTSFYLSKKDLHKGTSEAPVLHRLFPKSRNNKITRKIGTITGARKLTTPVISRISPTKIRITIATSKKRFHGASKLYT